MSPEDIKKLLGGYATGTLTTEEQQALFAAALEDQELFDALAREQSLRDLLRDPAARAELLSALEAPAPRPVGFWQWLRRPVVAGLATAGVAAIAIVAVWQGTRMASVSHQAQPVIVAELKRPELPPVPSTAQLLAPASQPATNKRDKDAGASATVLADKEIAPSVAPPSRRLEADSAVELLKQKKAVIAIAPSPPQAEENMRAQIAPAPPACRPRGDACRAGAQSRSRCRTARPNNRASHRRRPGKSLSRRPCAFLSRTGHPCRQHVCAARWRRRAAAHFPGGAPQGCARTNGKGRHGHRAAPWIARQHFARPKRSGPRHRAGSRRDGPSEADPQCRRLLL